MHHYQFSLLTLLQYWLLIYLPKLNMIEVKNLYKAFGEKEVLKGVDLHLSEGENLGIIGKSGVGKSVLTKCILHVKLKTHCFK